MEQSAAMGGYAGYLMVAYGVTALVVIGNIMAAAGRFRRTERRLREQLDRRTARPGPAGASSEQGSNKTTVGRRT